MSEEESAYGQSMSRAVRLVYLRDLLLTKPHTTDELAQLCNVSERTIYRDLADLQDDPFHVPIYRAWVWLEACEMAEK